MRCEIVGEVLQRRIDALHHRQVVEREFEHGQPACGFGTRYEGAEPENEQRAQTDAQSRQIEIAGQRVNQRHRHAFGPADEHHQQVQGEEDRQEGDQTAKEVPVKAMFHGRTS